MAVPPGLWATLGGLASCWLPPDAEVAFKRRLKGRCMKMLLNDNSQTEVDLLTSGQRLKSLAYDLQLKDLPLHGLHTMAERFQALDQHEEERLRPIVRLLLELRRDREPERDAFASERREPVRATGIEPYALELLRAGRDKLNALPALKPQSNFFAPKEERNVLAPIPALDLIAGPNGRDLRIPRPAMATDEGYESPKSLQGEENQRADEEDVWAAARTAIDVTSRQKRSWEHAGQHGPAPRERPYLTELGDQHGVELSWLLAVDNLRLIDPAIRLPEARQIEETVLVQHLGYLMAGIASQSFLYDDQHGGQFRLAPGTRVAGLAPDTLESFCEKFTACGLLVRRLEALCEGQQRGRNGSIHSGFLDGVEAYLCGYRAAALAAVRGEKRLLAACASLDKLADHVRFLGRLCKVDAGSAGQHLPEGVRLLAYLLERALHVQAEDLYYVVLAIVRRSAAPYFR